MVKSTTLFAALAATGLSNASIHHRAQDPSETIPSAFDGQYVTKPEPTANNTGMEWWWFQALGQPIGDVVPSMEAIFYEGFAFTTTATDPSWRFDVSGVFPNGTFWIISTPVTIPPTVSTPGGEAVEGNWGGLGSFSLAADRSYLAINFTAAAFGLQGTAVFKNLGTPAHGPCSNTITDPPYFESLSKGRDLTTSEIILYDQTGWAITMPRATAVVDLMVRGTHFTLDNAVGYHDHNWAPARLDKYAYTWLTGQGSCGPYDLTYLEVQTLGTARAGDILKGYLAKDGKVLQNQCSLYGSQTNDNITITLLGQTLEDATGVQVPTAMRLDYDLPNGKKYTFNLVNSVAGPSQLPYHRWRLMGSGGLVGGEQFDCLLIGDWLNPGIATYTEGSSIFEEQ